MRAQDTGSVPPIGAAEQAAARADLRYWRADVLVLPATKNADVLAETVTRLLGAGPVPVADVRVWDVRGLR
ncbi:Uncharacterised protein [Mycobacteroides abscessus subsp. abscessus]|nr:Uncharacterised protein [Mycobacteroides abscessus subsp. abscessus]